MHSRNYSVLIILLSLLICQIHYTNGQSELTVSHIAENTLYFDLDSELKGEGAEFLKKELEGAHYIAYGELHNSRQSAIIFKQILKKASRFGFDKLAVEVGPESAKILKRNSAQPEQAVSNLSDLYKKYNSRNYKYPIPFFKGVEDAEFLATARRLGFDLWGLDQEFAYAPPMLFDELLETLNEPDEVTEEIAGRAKKAWSKLKSSRSCQSLESDEISSYFGSFSAENEAAQAIINALKISWEIYCAYEKKDYKANNTKRINYMRGNLKQNIDDAISKGESPKVIVKMGSYHTSKVTSPLGYQDVGHLVDELANEMNQKAIYIRYMRRYWLGKDKIDSKDYESSRTFMTVGKREKWAVIDMRPLRKLIEGGQLKVSEYEKREIMNHDLMLMAPEDKWVKNNY